LLLFERLSVVQTLAAGLVEGSSEERALVELHPGECMGHVMMPVDLARDL